MDRCTIAEGHQLAAEIGPESREIDRCSSSEGYAQVTDPAEPAG